MEQIAQNFVEIVERTDADKSALTLEVATRLAREYATWKKEDEYERMRSCLENDM